MELAGIQAGAKILKFVIQQPAGSDGQRAWREVWLVNAEGKPVQLIITFREAGLDSATFEFQKM